MPLLKNERRTVLYIVASVSMILILFSLAAVFIDRNAIRKQERIFNNHQQMQAFLVCRALSDHLDHLILEPQMIARNIIPGYYEGAVPERLIKNQFRNKDIVSQKYIAQYYIDKNRNTVFSFFSEKEKSITKDTIKTLTHSWLNENWHALSSASENKPIIPPFAVSKDYQLVGVLHPVHIRGSFQGTVLTIINLNHLIHRFITPMRSGEYGAAYMIDEFGNVIFDHETEIIGQNIFGGMHKDYPDLMRFDKRITTEPQGQDEYHFTIKRGGEVRRKLAAWNSIPIGNRRLIVVLSAPDTEMDTGMSDLRLQRTLLSLMLVLVFAGFAALAFYYRHKTILQNSGKLEKLVEQKTRDIAAEKLRYKNIFEESPVSLWEFDFSKMREIIDPYIKPYPHDNADLFEVNKTLLNECASHMNIIDVNKTTLALFKSPNKETLFRRFNGIPSEQSVQIIKNGIIGLINGKTSLEAEAAYTIDDGSTLFVRLYAVAVPGHEDDWSRILVSLSDITDLKNGEELIKTSLAEKETLLRELYHRTKNNMQVICSMLSLQSGASNNVELKSAFKQMENKIHSMALVHQKLYQSQNLSSINLKEYTSDLTSHIIHSYEIYSGKVTTQLDCDDVFVLLDIAVPYGLILSELITNAMKYAFTPDEQGFISISLHRHDEEKITLTVTDNGRGPSPDFDPRTKGKMGLKSIIALAELQLQGKLEFSFNEGFSCTITFKDTLYKARV